MLLFKPRGRACGKRVKAEPYEGSQPACIPGEEEYTCRGGPQGGDISLPFGVCSETLARSMLTLRTDAAGTRGGSYAVGEQQESETGVCNVPGRWGPAVTGAAAPAAALPCAVWQGRAGPREERGSPRGPHSAPLGPQKPRGEGGWFSLAFLTPVLMGGGCRGSRVPWRLRHEVTPPGCGPSSPAPREGTPSPPGATFRGRGRGGMGRGGGARGGRILCPASSCRSGGGSGRCGGRGGSPREGRAGALPRARLFVRAGGGSAHARPGPARGGGAVGAR